VEPAVERDVRGHARAVLDRRLPRLAKQRAVLQVRQKHTSGEWRQIKGRLLAKNARVFVRVIVRVIAPN
jgi:hypothetical protein